MMIEEDWNEFTPLRVLIRELFLFLASIIIIILGIVEIAKGIF